MQVLKSVCLSSLFLSVVCQTGNDFFSSTITAPNLVNLHNQLVTVIRKYADAASEASAILQRYLEYTDISYVSDDWASDGDPLRTYHLIKRTSIDIDQLVDTIRNLRALDPLLELENLRQKRSLPEMNDFRGVAQALVRLQKVYRLNPAELARGKVTEKIQLPVKLSAADCLFLGQTAEYQEDLKGKDKMDEEALLWYQAGLGLTSDDPAENELKSQLHSQLARLHHQQQMRLPTMMHYQETGSSPPLMNLSISWEDVLRNYARLCRGERLRPPRMDINHSCHLRKGPHPYLRLRPVKVEELSLDPYLIILHDVIGDREIDSLKKEAVPLMMRSSHVADDGEGIETSDLRVSSTSWIEDDAMPALTARLSAITGMDANCTNLSAEQYQVLNYGIGGHYTPHFDYFEERANDTIFTTSGDRIATLMLYLSDVEAGGATAFPYLGITVWPLKGSAAFWWNLRSNGEGDPFTTHGACPVLYGTKWVSNKWFRYLAQMFHVPCGQAPETTNRRF